MTAQRIGGNLVQILRGSVVTVAGTYFDQPIEVGAGVDAPYIAPKHVNIDIATIYNQLVSTSIGPLNLVAVIYDSSGSVKTSGATILSLNEASLPGVYKISPIIMEAGQALRLYAGTALSFIFEVALFGRM